MRSRWWLLAPAVLGGLTLWAIGQWGSTRIPECTPGIFMSCADVRDRAIFVLILFYPVLAPLALLLGWFVTALTERWSRLSASASTTIGVVLVALPCLFFPGSLLVEDLIGRLSSGSG